jgi:hypothetical protein
MPDPEGRSTLAPLPSRGGNPNAVYQDEQQPDSSSGVPAEAEESQTATAEQAIEQQQDQGQEQQEQKDVPFHQHPRWQERQRELEAANRRAEEAERLARLAIERFQPTQQAPQPQIDPWKGLVDNPDPATAQYWQQVRHLQRAEAEAIVEQKLAGTMQAVDAGRRELATIKIAQFRKDNPEILPGSREESVIAGYVGQGFDLETARKLALFDKIEQENRDLKSKKNAIPRKANANVDASAGIPENSGLPRKASSWSERASEVYEKGGSLKDIGNAVFGKRK